MCLIPTGAVANGCAVYKTETELGLGIKESKVEREKLYVVTKALKGQDIENALKTSLKKLQLDNVDLYVTPFVSRFPLHCGSSFC